MRMLKTAAARSLLACSLAVLLPMSIQAWEPNARDLDAAISAGDFAGYFANISAWLDQKTPADPGRMTEAVMADLIKDPVFRSALDQRQLMTTHGVTNLGVFANGEAHREFLGWVMKSTERMDLYLQYAAPGIDALERWYKLYTDDPDSRNGVYLKLAIAAALWPPGGTGQYRGDETKDWVKRYNNYKTARQNKDLVPSFDHLLVCDYGRVLNCIGADTDINWARKMIQTWRPDLLEKEQIPKIVSEVWRRFSPFPFTNGFITVMEGGGKCGPRGIFGQFVCNALGIPAIGVGQPAHCCFAARCDYPETEPQAGSAWKVYQGRGWQVSDCGGCYGPQFVAEETRKYRTAEASMVTHLNWLASALSSQERADAARDLAKKVLKPVNTSDPLGVPANAVDIVLAGQTGRPPAEDRKPAPTEPAPFLATGPEQVKEEPFNVPAGVIHVEAEAFTNKSPEVAVFNCYTGGKQVNFFKSITNSWVDYVIDVPQAGTYAMEIMLAAANRDLVLDVSCGTDKLGTIKIPGTIGLWAKMAPVDIKLNKGPQPLRISAPFQRGIAVRWFELKAK